MQKLGNDIIHLSLERDTENTPTKDKYYLFKDGEIISSGSFNKLKVLFDKVIEENIEIIKEATKEFRDKPLDEKAMFVNWMNSGSNLSFFGGKPNRSAAEKVDLKNIPTK
jgi:hypothetical protein